MRYCTGWIPDVRERDEKLCLSCMVIRLPVSASYVHYQPVVFLIKVVIGWSMKNERPKIEGGIFKCASFFSFFFFWMRHLIITKNKCKKKKQNPTHSLLY